ncbi:hypothetical protein B0O99DRAFT_668238 [Bisporella sp. PMI_857]|nr:hypothetical protein B0O99DRAFT_668238 [Bisporella sp. PMI_857]
MKKDHKIEDNWLSDWCGHNRAYWLFEVVKDERQRSMSTFQVHLVLPGSFGRLLAVGSRVGVDERVDAMGNYVGAIDKKKKKKKKKQGMESIHWLGDWGGGWWRQIADE